MQVTKNNTDKLINQAVEVIKETLNIDVKSVNASYNVSRKTYVIELVYYVGVDQNNIITNIPLGLFTHRHDTKSVINDIVDTVFDSHFNAMLRNPLLSC